MIKTKKYKLPKTPCEIFYINEQPHTLEMITKQLANTITVQFVFNKLTEDTHNQKQEVK